MGMCVCIHAHVYMHTRVYVWIYACTCMSIHAHIHMYVCVKFMSVPLDPASHVGMVERPGEILHMPWVYVTPGSLRLRNLHYCKGGSWQNCPAFAL